MVQCSNKPAVTALRESADGRVKFNEDIAKAVETHLKEARARGIAEQESTRHHR